MLNEILIKGLNPGNFFPTLLWPLIKSPPKSVSTSRSLNCFRQ